MVVTAVHVRAEGVLAGVPAGPMSTVVSEGDGFGEGDVQAEAGGDGPGHLGYLEGVGEPGALVILREDEHLGLAGQRRNAVPCRTRSRSRSKQVRSGSGSSGRIRSPAPIPGVAAGLEIGSPPDSRSLRPITSQGSIVARLSTWAVRTEADP